MSIGKMFAKEVVTAVPRESLMVVAKEMERRNVGAVVIVEQGRAVGIVTDRDVGLAVCAKGVSPNDTVQKVMTCPVATLKHSDGVYDATQQMLRLGVRRLPVVDDSGRPVGLVSLDDLLLLLSRELNSMAEGIRPTERP